MTRLGTTLLLVGLLIVGLGGAAFLLPFLAPVDAKAFETAVLALWGLGAVMVVGGGAILGIGKATSRT